MILGLLISILSATYTITSSSSVEESGNIPVGSEATYSRSGTTGRVGQMTAGNSTLLVLDNWGGIEIDSIALEMRSNKTAGAGSLNVSIGEDVVCKIKDADFSDKNWNGDFSDEWCRISRWIGEKVGIGEQIKILIQASKNSLYVNSYTIYYTLPEPEAYTVSFVSGIGLEIPNSTEKSPLSGITLPCIKDTLDWTFIGWSESEVLESDSCPRIWQADEVYYPASHCKLWAVYTNERSQEAISNYVSGEYALVNTFWSRAMVGGIEDGMVSTRDVELSITETSYALLDKVTDDMVYAVNFLTDSTLTIENIANEEWIGYNEKGLDDSQKIWHYHILSDQSLCIHQPQGVLFWGFGADAMQEYVVVYNAKVDWTLMQADGLRLFDIQNMYFTTWPFGKIDGVEDIIIPEFIEENTEYILHLGSYELHIQNGKKWLFVR